jgi:hypothetical protein
MTHTAPGNVFEASRVLAALRELIGALDSRTPQAERAGESRIARDAQQLRRAAVARIEELTGAGPEVDRYDQELVEAIMTDDGGPQPRPCLRHGFEQPKQKDVGL